MTFERLQRNMALNESLASAISAHNLGVGREAGSLHWLQSSAGEGNGRLIDHRTAHSISVPVTTLDQFTATHPFDSIDFIKIDVERMELDVILGGLETLRAHHPVIMFGTLPYHGITKLKQNTHSLLSTLRDIGYELHGIGRRRVVRFTADELPPTYETLALPT